MVNRLSRTSLIIGNVHLFPHNWCSFGSYPWCECVWEIHLRIDCVAQTFTATHTAELPICPRWRGGAVWREHNGGYDIHLCVYSKAERIKEA